MSADGGKPKVCHCEELENECGAVIQLYGHAVTRGGRGKTTLTPAPTPVAWTPTLGEERNIAKFSCKTLGQFAHSMEDTSGSAPKLTGCLRPVFGVLPQVIDSVMPKRKRRQPPFLCHLLTTRSSGRMQEVARTRCISSQARRLIFLQELGLPCIEVGKAT